MPYFPLFVDLTGKHVLVVGGGTVALRKVEKLLPFGPQVTVVAPQLHPQLREYPDIRVRQEPFAPWMLQDTFLVIAASDDRDVNREVSRLCQERNLPVNAVDDRDACTFLFPALVQKGPLTVGISTGGASPAAAAWLRQRIQKEIPDAFDDILLYMESLRPRIRGIVDGEKNRKRIYQRILASCLEADRPLTDSELNDLLKQEGIEP